jgi:hypothetical protein
MDRRRFRNVALIVVFGVALGIGSGVTYAAFSWTTANGANTLATDADWTAPTGSSVIARSGSTVGGSIAQGSGYYVYANATDSGNPASGVASVVAGVANLTTSPTSATLTTTGGPWTISGVSYAYRSPALTAKNPLTAGIVSYTLTLTDTHVPANTGTQTFSVTVDNAGPSASDIQAINGGAQVGLPEAGDVITFTFTEPMDPASILASWTGAAATVRVKFQNNGCAGADALTVLDSSGGTGVHLGTVCLGGDFVNGQSFFTTSTMVMTGNTVIVTLGGSDSMKAASNTTLSWTPSTLATDIAGNAMAATAVNESGTVDTDF